MTLVSLNTLVGLVLSISFFFQASAKLVTLDMRHREGAIYTNRIYVINR